MLLQGIICTILQRYSTILCFRGMHKKQFPFSNESDYVLDSMVGFYKKFIWFLFSLAEIYIISVPNFIVQIRQLSLWFSQDGYKITIVTFIVQVRQLSLLFSHNSVVGPKTHLVEICPFSLVQFWLLPSPMHVYHYSHFF